MLNSCRSRRKKRTAAVGAGWGGGGAQLLPESQKKTQHQDLLKRLRDIVLNSCRSRRKKRVSTVKPDLVDQAVLNSCRSRRKKRPYGLEAIAFNVLCSTPAGVAEKNACRCSARLASGRVLNSCRSRRKKRMLRRRHALI